MMSAKVRQYTTAIANTTDVADIELSCMVCQTSCTGGETYAEATHIYKYNSSITATFK